MTDSTNLQTTLRELRRKGRYLARQVDYELTRIETTGIAPSSKTLAMLAEFQKEFDRLAAVIAPSASIRSLTEMEQALARSAVHAVLAKVVEPILALQHADDPAYAPLADLHRAAVKMEREIGRGTADPETTNALADGSHVWCRLLDLIVKGDRLGDTLWSEYFEFVEANLGSGLAIAATRGKLRLSAKLRAIVAGDAQPGQPRDSVAVPRAEEFDPLLINRPNRQPLPEKTPQQTIFDESQFSGVQSSPGESELSELDALEDPEGAGSDFDEEEIDFGVDITSAFLEAAPPVDDVPSGPRWEARRDYTVPNAGTTTVRPVQEFFPPRDSDANPVVSFGGAAAVPSVPAASDPQHSDAPKPCPNCGDDIFPAMARCRSCGLKIQGDVPFVPPSTVSGLFRLAPDVEAALAESEFSGVRSSAASDAGFVLNPHATGTDAPQPQGWQDEPPREIFAAPPVAEIQAAEPAVSVERPPAAEIALPEPAVSPPLAADPAAGAFELKSKEPQAKLRTICDKCTAEFPVSKALAGQLVTCPTCGEQTQAPSADATRELSTLSSVTRDVDITLYTVREAVEAALGEKPSLAAREWEQPLSRSQWKTLSGAVAAITPASNPLECERVKPLFETLGQSNDERAAELLRTKFHDFPVALRVEALKALERLRDPAAVPLMMRSLYEEKSPTLPVAMSALIAFRETRAVQPLCLLGVAAPEHRERVLLTLADFGEVIVPELSRLATPAHSDAIRFLVFESLGRMQTARAIPALVTGLKEENKLIQRVAAEGLSHIRSKKVIRPLIEALQNPDEMVRTHASAGLRENPDPKSAKFLLRSLRDKSLDVRKNIVAAIGLSGDESVVESIKRFLVDPSREMMVVASEALGRLGQNSAVPKLVKMLEEETASNEDRALIQRIFKALHVLKDRRSLVPLIGYLESTDPMIRRRAVEALGPIQDPSARRALEEALRNDKTDEVRAAAALALGEQGQKHAIPALEAALAGSERVRVNALQAIGMLQERTSMPKVITLLSDPNVRVRQVAVACLGAIKNPAAIPRLLDLVRDPDEHVRREVLAALAALGEKRTEQELLGDVKSRPATNAPTTVLMDTISFPQASQTRSRRSLVASLTDIGVGIFGYPLNAVREMSPRKIASVGSGLAMLVVAVVFFNVQGSGVPPYRRAYVASAAISNDGLWAATGRTSQGVEIWDVARQVVTDYNPGLPQGFVTFGAKPDELFCVGRNNVLRVALAEGRVGEIKDLGAHDDQIIAVASTPDGRFLATASPLSVRVWNTEQANVAYEIPYAEGFKPDDPAVRGRDAGLRAIALSDDGTLVAVATTGAGARMWESGTLLGPRFPSKTRLTGAAIRTDGQALLLLDVKGVMAVFDIATGKKTGGVQAASQQTTGLYFIDSTQAVQVYANCVSMVDLKTGETKANLFDLTNFDAVDLRADRQTIAVGHNEASPLYLVNVAGGTLETTLDVQH